MLITCWQFSVTMINADCKGVNSCLIYEVFLKDQCQNVSFLKLIKSQND